MINSIKNIGISSATRPYDIIKIRTINLMCVVGIAVLLTQIAMGLILDLSLYLPVYYSVTIVLLFIPLYLNAIQKMIASGMAFLTTAYFSIAFMSSILGEELNSHLYIIPCVTIGLTFFSKTQQIYRWLCIVLAGLSWIIPKIYLSYYNPIVEIENTMAELMAEINVGITLIVSIVIIYVFSSQNDDFINQIENQKRLINVKNEELTQFNYILTHDLKAPAISIASLSDIIEETIEEEKLQLPESLIQPFHLLKKKSKGLVNIIKGITEYFKTSVHEQFEWVNTEKEIKEIIELISGDKIVNIRLDSLPYLYTPSIAFRRICQNLLTNAIKYTKNENPCIHIYYTESNGKGHLNFQDNGQGIDKTQQKQIFNLFSMIDKSEENSSGIGLAIVKKLVEETNGEIYVQSEIGKGSNFYLSYNITSFKRNPS